MMIVNDKLDYIIINDGDCIPEIEVKKYNIENYCIKNSNNDYICNFVGIIIQQNNLIVSFPKNFIKQNNNNYNNNYKDIIKKILNIIIKERIKTSGFDNGMDGEFPVKPYSEILNYYKKYNLYKRKSRNYKNGYSGKIDWIKTINKSKMIIQKNGIIFMPFKIQIQQDINTFLTFIMDYILTDATKYISYLSIIEPYNSVYQNFNKVDKSFIIKKLKYIKGFYYKDSEKNLIQNMIYYLEWKLRYNNTFILLTKEFFKYWESMVMKYLNRSNIDILSHTISYTNTISNKFYQPNFEYVESDEILNTTKHKHYKIQYDHFFKDDINKIIYIYDSKYFNDIKQLNYKQLFYHYHLKNKYSDYTIINGLILPSDENKYKTITHINRLDLDDVIITEHYILYNNLL